ncbi:MAG TPA: mercuric reductase [Herpetosiphonaceae bacterium]|nr:mercuric reductase [Herpetosiphonaceae bacterium]
MDMAQHTHYDVIIIGAGQSGGPLSTAFAQAGRKTALIEREHVGGTCINVGCTPTKTMIASARVAYLARRSAEYGIHADHVTIDLSKVRQRKRDIVESWRSGSRRRIEGTDGVDLLDGEARFKGSKTLDVRLSSGETRSLTANVIVINTGARPTNPAVEGLRDGPTLNSTTIMELDEIPEHLLILGGGYVGLEFGQMFRRFGSKVTIVQRGDQLLAREDTDIAEEVAKILREDGIQVLLKTDAQRVAQSADGMIQLTVCTAAGNTVCTGSHLLIAAGRTPNTDALTPHVAGIETDRRGHIKVNERLETNVPGIYALGDVNGGPAFTHISYDDFRIMRTNLLDGGDAVTSGRLVPYTVFIDPQLGRVGLTEHEARQQGRTIQVAKLPMNSVARAIEVDETRGFMKAIVDVESQQILGCAVLGIEGGEIMSAVQIAMMGKLPYTALRDGIFAHPTLVESLNNLFMTLEEQ